MGKLKRRIVTKKLFTFLKVSYLFSSLKSFAAYMKCEQLKMFDEPDMNSNLKNPRSLGTYLDLFHTLKVII